MELYWLLILPHLHEVFSKASVLLIILSVICMLITVLSLIDDDDVKLLIPYRWLVLKIASFAFFISILNCFIPTQTDLALMMGWDALKN